MKLLITVQVQPGEEEQAADILLAVLNIVPKLPVVVEVIEDEE